MPKRARKRRDRKPTVNRREAILRTALTKQEDSGAVRSEVVIPLTAEERAQKAHCEAQMAKAFADLSIAVLCMSENRLYREEFPTFEAYCELYLGISRIHGYRLAEAGRVVRLLLPMGNIPMPKCERHIRPLTALDPPLVPDVWRKALEKASQSGIKQYVATKHVEEAIIEVLGEHSLSAERTKSNGDKHLTHLEAGLLSLVHKMATASALHILTCFITVAYDY